MKKMKTRDQQPCRNENKDDSKEGVVLVWIVVVREDGCPAAAAAVVADDDDDDDTDTLLSFSTLSTGHFSLRSRNIANPGI